MPKVFLRSAINLFGYSSYQFTLLLFLFRMYAISALRWQNMVKRRNLSYDSATWRIENTARAQNKYLVIWHEMSYHNVNNWKSTSTHPPPSLLVSVFPSGICRPILHCGDVSEVFFSTWECLVCRDVPTEQLMVSPYYFTLAYSARNWRASRPRTVSRPCFAVLRQIALAMTQHVKQMNPGGTRWGALGYPTADLFLVIWWQDRFRVLSLGHVFFPKQKIFIWKAISFFFSEIIH